MILLYYINKQQQEHHHHSIVALSRTDFCLHFLVMKSSQVFVESNSWSYEKTHNPSCDTSTDVMYLTIFKVIKVSVDECLETVYCGKLRGTAPLTKVTKNGFEILVGQVVFKLWIKIFKMFFFFFSSITQEPLGLPKFDASLEFLGQFIKRCIYHFSNRC